MKNDLKEKVKISPKIQKNYIKKLEIFFWEFKLVK
jgi:hypothetical protein